MGPIFNIFFINKVAVGPINSTVTVPLQCYLSPPYCKTREMKKKKKRRNADARRKFQPNPNGTLVELPLQIFVVNPYLEYLV